jgi:endonuclease YncB( thermonuclease family)
MLSRSSEMPNGRMTPAKPGRTWRMKSAWIALMVVFAPGVAFGDPCTAPLPSRVGAAFAGEVRYVGDGDSLCVGADADPATWIEVRLGDFDAPELYAPGGRSSKAFLERAALGRQTSCHAVRGRNGRVVVYDRVIAVCRISGQSIGDALRAAGAPAGGN